MTVEEIEAQVDLTSETVIGIDLGTTNSRVAIMDKISGYPLVILNEDGERITPSIVAFTKDSIFIGKRAKNQASTNPKGTFFGVKKLIGKMFSDSSIKRIISTSPFLIVGDSNRDGAAAFEINGKIYSPQEISSNILRSLKQAAEKNLGRPVKSAVITVPVYFNDAQRQATKDAGQIAGLEILSIINEPMAAALAYGLDTKKNGKIAVYDFGGGTFDVSILDINDGTFEILATNSDASLSGENIDEVIVDFLIEEIRRYYSGIDIKKLDKQTSLRAIQRIRIESENAKKSLSTTIAYDIDLPYLAMINGEPLNFSYTLTKGKLEELARKLVDKTIEPCKKAMSDAKVYASDIDEVILVGGMTNMPLVQATVKRIFQKKPLSIVNPDEAVVLGAAI